MPRLITSLRLSPLLMISAAVSGLTGLSSSASAKGVSPSPELSEALPPPKSQWVSYRKVAPVAPPTVMTPELVKDPKQLLAYIQSKPNALDVSAMPDVGLALEVAQLLLFNGEPTKGLQVLMDARVRWPQDMNLTFAWARAMISLGTPSYGRPPLEAILKAKQSEMPYHNYTRYLLALSIFLEGEDQPEELRKTLALLEEVLTLDPNFVAPDGMTAAKLRNFVEDLKKKTAGVSAPSDFVH